MSIEWNANCSDVENAEAKVTKCVAKGDAINILFEGVFKGEPIEGRLQLENIEGEQNTKGIWRFTDKKRVKARFTETPTMPGEVEYIAEVIGNLEECSNNQLVFEGTWDETKHNPVDGFTYDLCIDTAYTT